PDNPGQGGKLMAPQGAAKTFSVKVRLKEDLFRDVEQAAAEGHRSVNSEIVFRIEEFTRKKRTDEAIAREVVDRLEGGLLDRIAEELRQTDEAAALLRRLVTQVKEGKQ